MYEPLWWRCGRYVLLTVRAGDADVRLKRLEFVRAGYPLDVVGAAAADDPRLDALMPLCLAGLRACMHETYMDCPYYEQLMYVGDTRVQALMTYALSRDDRLARKAISAFDLTRGNPTGLTYSNTGPGGQMIPPFALWWVCMVHDHAMWVGEKGFVREKLVGVRGVLEEFLGRVRREDGMYVSGPGWNYVDAGFEAGGVPPGGEEGGVSVAINLQLVLALDAAAELEKWAGESELATRYERRAAEVMWGVEKTFSAGDALADDVSKTRFSEQTNALAILTGRLDPGRNERIARGMASGVTGWTKAQLYFTHYLFEAAAMTRVPELLLSRLGRWYEMQAMGFRAMPETYPTPGNETRSDCHAWSSHPMFHVAASVVGVRPTSFGFETVRVRPMMGELRRASVAVAHPRGLVRAAVATEGGSLVAKVELPAGVRGVFEWGSARRELVEGGTEVRVEAGEGHSKAS